MVQYLAYKVGEPFVFVQAYRVMAHQAEGGRTRLIRVLALGVDQFIVLPERLGQGLGTRMLKASPRSCWRDQSSPEAWKAEPCRGLHRAGAGCSQSRASR